MSQIEDFVAEAVNINVPFNYPVTGVCAFTHKDGIHAKVGNSQLQSYILKVHVTNTKFAGYPCQPLYIRDHQPGRLRYEPIRTLHVAPHWMERHQESRRAARLEDDR